MLFHSTNKKSATRELNERSSRRMTATRELNERSSRRMTKKVSFREALMSGLADDGGLFLPDSFPRLSGSFLKGLGRKSFQEIAFEVSRKFIRDIPDRDLKRIISDSFGFEVPVRKISGKTYVLELWHGPTLAFKDFGARFMARLMSHYLREDRKVLNIVVATSGDTGSAVAAGFYGLPNINVFVLYPSGRVTDLQEKQMATPGKNITAIEVRGSFDDCQKMAKQILSDRNLAGRIRLSSANSINFGRLLPQSFYYWSAFAEMRKSGVKQFSFCVPSGNFGNLTAGLIAKRMGMDVSQFIAATNSNDIVPRYLDTGRFVSRVSRRTISNAMDVGNPSNFARISEMFHGNVKKMRKEILGISVSDKQTRETIRNVYRETKYVVDPHTAVGIAAVQEAGVSRPVVVLSTAHPSKFRETVEPVIKKKIKLPKQLSSIVNRKNKSVMMDADPEQLKKLILKKNSA